MVRRKGTNMVAVILILLAVSMTAFGAYMSFMEPTVYIIDDGGTDTTTPVVTDPVYTDGTRPVRWDYIQFNLFGEDGQVDIWNMMLFVGMALFVVAFIMMRR